MLPRYHYKQYDASLFLHLKKSNFFPNDVIARDGSSATLAEGFPFRKHRFNLGVLN
jgi:hypothetical protein